MSNNSLESSGNLLALNMVNGLARYIGFEEREDTYFSVCEGKLFRIIERGFDSDDSAEVISNNPEVIKLFEALNILEEYCRHPDDDRWEKILENSSDNKTRSDSLNIEPDESIKYLNIQNAKNLLKECGEGRNKHDRLILSQIEHYLRWPQELVALQEAEFLLEEKFDFVPSDMLVESLAQHLYKEYVKHINAQVMDKTASDWAKENRIGEIVQLDLAKLYSTVGPKLRYAEVIENYGNYESESRFNIYAYIQDVYENAFLTCATERFKVECINENLVKLRLEETVPSKETNEYVLGYENVLILTREEYNIAVS